MNAFDRLIDALREHGSIVNVNGHTAKAQCPAHDDTNPSLAIRATESRVLLCCHAHCDNAAIVAALGLSMRDLFDKPRGGNLATYSYPGGLVVHRRDGKTFSQSGNKTDRSLFHADRIGDAETVYVCEGEEDVFAVESAGGAAVCNAMGAGKAHLFDWSALKGKTAIVIADNDDTGRKHARQVVELITPIAASVRIVTAKIGKDASDHIAAGYTLNQLVPLEEPEPVDGAKLLNELRDVLTDFVVFPGEPHSSAAVALWILATHALPAFDCAPRLVITSPQKRCAKTRLLDIIVGTSHHALPTSDATVAAIFRSLGGEHPRTLVIDEADAMFGNKKLAEQNEDLRKLLNAGHQRGRPALRCVGQSQIPVEFNVFAMAALAGIGDMPDTITDRAVNITLRRRAPAEKVSQFRSRRNGPVLEKLRGQLADWAAARIDELTDAEPNMPVEDRAADTWEPLIAIADAAGGHWPKTARAACKALVAAADEADEDRSLGVKLLADIRQVFTEKGTPFVSSADLVDALGRIAESPWNDFELTQRKLANDLRKFGVKSSRAERNTVRGYTLKDLRDAFSRYLRPQASTRPQTDTDQEQRVDATNPVDAAKCPRDLSVHDESAGQMTFEDGWTHEDAYPPEPTGFKPPTGPGRCPKCGWHVPTQGHLRECSANPWGSRDE